MGFNSAFKGLINNALGTQEKGNRLLFQAKQICIKTIQQLQPCSGDFCSTLFSDCELIAIKEILHHYSTLNFKTSCLFQSQFPLTCFNLEEHLHISKIFVQGF
jgi:hypothetical protein